MTRLQAELNRLYLPQGPSPRAMVLELSSRCGWEPLSRVWRGVQADLTLPAPAIAVTGREAFQLWFSLSEAVPADQVGAFLEGLRRRYLGDIGAECVKTMPASADGAMPVLPPAQVAADRWSAFVSPDLAPVFADEPWLDHPPGAEAQADLLSQLEPASAQAFERAVARLRPVEVAEAAAAPTATPGLDPLRFLRDVMNDPSVELRWRIEAAKALLPHSDRSRGSD